MQNADRPLSPHLSVYRFKYTLLSSITNRITGLALSIALPVLVYWLAAVAGGAEDYARVVETLGSPVLKVVYFGFLLAFSYHLVAGIRHLVWDTGRGLERAQSERSAWLVAIVALIVAAALAGWLFLGGFR